MILIQTKIECPPGIHKLICFCLSGLGPLGFLLLKTSKIIGFPIFWVSVTEEVISETFRVGTELDIYAFMLIPLLISENRTPLSLSIYQQYHLAKLIHVEFIADIPKKYPLLTSIAKWSLIFCFKCQTYNYMKSPYSHGRIDVHRIQKSNILMILR